MKFVYLKTNAVIAIIAAVVMAISVPANAEDKGFILEDSIREQIFMELKSNVRSLYQNANLIVPTVDTSIAARIASTSKNGNRVLPVISKHHEKLDDETVETIN